MENRKTKETGLRAGDSVALYRFDRTANTLIPVPGGNLTVAENGTATLALPAKDFAEGPDRYVLLPNAGAAAPAWLPAGSGTAYEIRKGDTLNKVAREYGCTVQELTALNHIADVYDLRIGQVI